MSLTAKITVSGADANIQWLRGEKNRWGGFKTKKLRELGEKGKKFLAQEVPRASGALAKNATYAFEGADNVRIWTFAHNVKGIDYAPIILGKGKTRASPGRFVPGIGKRLISTERLMFGGKRLPGGSQVFQKRSIGMHPGSRRTDAYGATALRLLAWIDGQIKAEVTRVS